MLNKGAFKKKRFLSGQVVHPPPPPLADMSAKNARGSHISFIALLFGHYFHKLHEEDSRKKKLKNIGDHKKKYNLNYLAGSGQ